MRTNLFLTTLSFVIAIAGLPASRASDQQTLLTLGIAVRCPYGLTG